MKKPHIVGVALFLVVVAAITSEFIRNPSVLSRVYSGGYVPTTQHLEDPENVTTIFNIRERDLQGIFCYIDNYSLAYTYRTEVQDREEFWNVADSRAGKNGWTRISDHGVARTYRRRSKPEHRAVEEVRIGVKEDMQVVVAYASIPVAHVPESLDLMLPEVNIWSHFSDAMR